MFNTISGGGRMIFATNAQDPMSPHDIAQDYYPLISFTLGSMAGLADLLRSGRKITLRLFAASMLWHGLMATAASLILNAQIESRPMLYGISILVGTGAYSMIDIVVAGIRAKLGNLPSERK